MIVWRKVIWKVLDMVEMIAEQYAKPKPASGQRSMWDEEDHPRGQPENAGEFAPKGGAGASNAATDAGKAGSGTRTASTPTASNEAVKQHAATVSAFEAAFSKPAPLWQPKMFDAEPTGQKTMFDAGIEKGHGKKKPAAKQLSLGPSLIEQFEDALVKQAKENRPLPSQKAMFSRNGAVERYGVEWVRAPKGGAVSPVNSQRYEGGEFMPIHGHSEDKAKEKKKGKPSPTRKVRNRFDELVEVPEDHIAIESLVGGHPLKSHKLNDDALSYLRLTRKQTVQLRDIYESGDVSIPREIVPKSDDGRSNWDIEKSLLEWKEEQGRKARQKDSDREQAIIKEEKRDHQKQLFARGGAVERYQQQWDESKHPRDALGRFAESHAQAHVASGKAFREWASQHAVPALKERGYGDVEAQQIAFKAAQRVHRREKTEPIQNAVKDAVDILNHWADKKGPPVAQNIGEPEQNIGEPAESIGETAEVSEEQSIPDAPEWFNRLKETLEQRKTTGATAENPMEADIGKTSVSPDGDGDNVHFKEWTPDDGVEAAPPPQPAKMPDAIEPLTALHQTSTGGLVGATQMHVNDLKADPKRFQYKFVGVGEDGVTKELKDAKRFNPMLGGQLLVWRDPGDGQTYVINGHHRFDLAKRSLASGESDDGWNGNLSVYFIDADSPATARALGAVTNIAEGRGTAVDAAKFLRDANADITELEKHGVSAKGAMARDAVPLSKLSPRIWQKVAQETVTPARGLAIAKHLGGDPDAQDQLFNIVEQREQKTGKDIPDSHVEEMAREMSMTPKHTEGGGGLFGDFFERSLLPERANLKAAVRRAIMGEKNAFAAVSSTKRAGTLQSDGKNTLDTEGNRERAQQSARQLEDFEQQSNWAGNPIAAAVNEAAQRLANEPRKAKSIEKQLIEHVRGILAGGQSGDGNDQLGPSRQSTEDADATGSRHGEPERNSRRSAKVALSALFESALRRQLA